MRGDPSGCVRWLNTGAELWRTTVELVMHTPGLTVLDVELGPPPPELPGYPAEHVRITVRANGEIFAVPMGGDQRPWLHRYPRLTLGRIVAAPLGERMPWEQLLGCLCLWYPRDPEHLHWRWADGLDGYVRLVQRHLWSEKYWRRHDHWPAEDAPHGTRPDGRPHPILTPTLLIAS